MVNGAGTTYIEIAQVLRTSVRFADNGQLMNICRRIVSQIGRRVDESSPICDARLPDGSRVNVIAPPLAVDGPVLTIENSSGSGLTLHELARLGSIFARGPRAARDHRPCPLQCHRVGRTGSGKTTLLNCLSRCIDNDERIITCEDAAELQLQQPTWSVSRPDRRTSKAKGRS